MIGWLWAAWLAATPANAGHGGDGSAEAAAAAPPVDVNHADLTTLCTLPGIGPRKAEGIIALRSRRPLTRTTQLLQVKGIGPKLLDRLRGRILLRPPPPRGPSPLAPDADVRVRPGSGPAP